MLTHLAIRDVVLIQSLDLELAAGLTVLTGETGAGKSIILDALGLVLGARSEARLVRTGAAQASVTAQFDLPPRHPAFAFLAANEIPVGDFIIRRVVGADGKSKAFVNDTPVGVGLLRELSPMLVDVHGQFETHGLMNPATHLTLLDRFAGHEKLMAAAAAHHADWRAKTDALENLKAIAARAAADEAFLRSAVAELEDITPQVGEEEKLAARRTMLQQQEKLFEVLRYADEGLGQMEGTLLDVRRQVEKLVDKTGEVLSPLSATLDALYDALANAQGAAQAIANQVNNDDASLEESETRLFALRALARKHHCTVDDLSDKQREFSQQLLLIEDQGDLLARLETETVAARAAYVAAAEKLSSSRRAAAEKLARVVQKELAPLKLEKAKLDVTIEPLQETQWGALGMDSVRMVAAMNPGQAAAPLHKTASGGELARLLLAIKVVLAKVENIPVLVFDEVDTGIGGAVADAVGERLGRLAEGAQVLVITHAPQVAARGAQHWQVQKQQGKKETTTTVSVLTGAARQEEIARMLSGAEISNEARQGAARMLAG
jgi:DNA repair protein RecN (Recombination protein N)